MATKRKPRNVSLGSLDHLMQQERAERRTMPLGITAAVVLHVLAFAMTWPSIAGPPPEPPEKRIYHRVPLISHVPEPPPPAEIPKPQVRHRRVQIPDPNPDEPKVFRELPPPKDIDIPEGWIDPKGVSIPEPPPPVRDTVIAGKDVHPPEVRHSVPPQYTKPALVVMLEGDVVLRLTIDPTGRVVSTEVLKPLGLGLTEAAIEATSQWIFEPCRVNGREVTVIYDLTVKFRLTR